MAKKRKTAVDAIDTVVAPKEPKLKVKISDLQSITPLTKTQEKFFKLYHHHKAFMLLGVAGSGKTFIALYKAFEEILRHNNPLQTITIIRSVVPSRDIGYLPGDEKEKSEVYTRPYVEMAASLFPRFKDQAFSRLREQKLVEFMTTSFVRGLTLENRIVIIDEAQNMTDQELHSIFTRLGQNTKIIVCGDYQQTDLHKKGDVSGLKFFVEVALSMPSFQFCEFGIDDIVRGELVKEYIIARLQKETT